MRYPAIMQAMRAPSPATMAYRIHINGLRLSIINVMRLADGYRRLMGIRHTPEGVGAFEGSHAPIFFKTLAQWFWVMTREKCFPDFFNPNRGLRAQIAAFYPKFSAADKPSVVARHC